MCYGTPKQSTRVYLTSLAGFVALLQILIIPCKLSKEHEGSAEPQLSITELWYSLCASLLRCEIDGTILRKHPKPQVWLQLVIVTI